MALSALMKAAAAKIGKPPAEEIKYVRCIATYVVYQRSAISISISILGQSLPTWLYYTRVRILV
jgi:hypothetical protein